IDFIFAITAYPYILDYILDNPICVKIMDNVHKRITKLIKFATSSLLAYILNYMCMTVLKNNPMISHKEIKYIIKNNTISGTLGFIKLVTITVLIHYLENTYYATLVKIIYKYIQGNKIIHVLQLQDTDIDPLPHISDRRDKINYIITNRQWEEFMNEKIIKILVEIYAENSKGHFKQYIKDVFYKLEIMTAKFFAIYSLATFFDNAYIAIIVSTCMLMSSRNGYIPAYLSKAAGIVVLYLNFKPIYAVIIAEYFELLDNKITRWLVTQIYNKYNKYMIIFYHDNRYNRDIISSIAVLYYINNCLTDSIYTKIILSMLINISGRHMLIGTWFSVFGYISNYNPFHMILLGGVIYEGNNIWRSGTLQFEHIKLEIINSYITFKSKYITNNITDSVAAETKCIVDCESDTEYMDINMDASMLLESCTTDSEDIDQDGDAHDESGYYIVSQRNGVYRPDIIPNYIKN
ncbi:MAG: hypothetical protein Faunusvirus1_1, partial [Faunusvirus sp.]